MVDMHKSLLMSGSVGHLLEEVFPFHLLSSGDGIQVIRLGSNTMSLVKSRY